MVAAAPNFRGGLKILDQNNWGGDLSKKLNWGEGGDATFHISKTC